MTSTTSHTPRFDSLQVGDTLPTLQLEPVSRLMLALYCGASGDHNPIHVDLDFARSAGQADQRQVEGARLALQHNLGLGGACVVTLYQRA